LHQFKAHSLTLSAAEDQISSILFRQKKHCYSVELASYMFAKMRFELIVRTIQNLMYVGVKDYL